MKGLSVGRRIAVSAALAALVAGVVIAAASGGSSHAHRRAARPEGPALARVPLTAQPPAATGPASTQKSKRTGTPRRGGSAAPGPSPAHTRPQAAPGIGARGTPGTEAQAAPEGQLQVAARYLGVSPESVRKELEAGRTLAQVAAARPGRSAGGLIDALVAFRTGAIQAAAAAGKITKDAETRRLGRVRRTVTAAVTHGRPWFAAMAAIGPSARYLGVDAATLRGQLRHGRTLAEVADSTSGRSASGLVGALVAARRAVLDRGVKSGRLKRSREQQLLTRYRERASATIRVRIA